MVAYQPFLECNICESGLSSSSLISIIMLAVSGLEVDNPPPTQDPSVSNDRKPSLLDIFKPRFS